jgi:hypothetical protein
MHSQQKSSDKLKDEGKKSKCPKKIPKVKVFRCVILGKVVGN